LYFSFVSRALHFLLVITSKGCIEDYKEYNPIEANGEVLVETDGKYFVIYPKNGQGGIGYKFAVHLLFLLFVEHETAHNLNALSKNNKCV
jgi:hypothetical protein